MRKWLISGGLAALTVFGLVGCASGSIDASGNNYTLGIGRFTVVKILESTSDETVSLLRDNNTGVEYVWIHDTRSGSGLSPYYDSNGHIVVDKDGHN
jgi:hypothetical protein